jgi:hypothetical protein
MRIPHPGSGANFWVVDGNHPTWDALTWEDQLSNVTVKVDSVDSLVKACVRSTIENSRAIDFLAIFGHGTGGYQAIGAGKAFEKSGTKSLWWKSVTRPGETQLFGPAEKALLGLNGVLSNDATIFLAGCEVGDGEYGTGLLTTISTILRGRTVQAFEDKVYWWSGHLVGKLKEARGTDVDSSYSMYCP